MAEAPRKRSRARHNHQMNPRQIDIAGIRTTGALGAARTAVVALTICAGLAGSAQAETVAAITPSLSPDRLHARAALTFTIRFAGGAFGVPSPVRRSVVRFPAGLSLDIPDLRSCTAARLRCARRERLPGAVADRQRARARGGACGDRDDHRGRHAVGVPRPAAQPPADVRDPRPRATRRSTSAMVLTRDRCSPIDAPYGEELRDVDPPDPHAAVRARRVDRHLLARRSAPDARPPDARRDDGPRALPLSDAAAFRSRPNSPTPTARSGNALATIPCPAMSATAGSTATACTRRALA